MMSTRILNRSKDFLFALPWVEQASIEQLKGKVSCLLYHRIEPYGRCKFLDQGGSPVTSTGDLEKELLYLKSLQVRFFTLEQLQKFDIFVDSDTIGIVICFDDGFKCNYIQGLDILAKHDVPAVFFQCTEFIDAKDLIWEHKLYWLDHNPIAKNLLHESLLSIIPESIPDNGRLVEYVRENISPPLIESLTAEISGKLSTDSEISQAALQIYPGNQDLKTALALGHELASHGHSHYKRSSITENIFTEELTRSKLILTEVAGKEPISYSYPFNSFTEADHKIANKLYKNIATVSNSRIGQQLRSDFNIVPRLAWPGISHNKWRRKRWILTGSF